MQATTLVMDEADMLMEGSYKKQLDDILVAFRRADRVAVEEDSLVDGQVKMRGIDKTQYGEPSILSVVPCMVLRIIFSSFFVVNGCSIVTL